MRPPDTLDHLVVRIDGLAGIPPVPAEDVELELARTDVVVVHVGDLELAAARRLQLRDDVENVGLVAIEARDGETAWWIRRLLDDLRDAGVLDARDAEMTEMLGLADMREQDARAFTLFAEVVNRLRDRPSEDVVCEHYDDAGVTDELAGKAERVRDPAGALLVSVLELIAEQPPEVAHMLSTGDQHQLCDSGFPQSVDGIHHHWPVVDGQEVLVRDPRQRIQTRTGPAG